LLGKKNSSKTGKQWGGIRILARRLNWAGKGRGGERKFPLDVLHPGTGGGAKRGHRRGGRRGEKREKKRNSRVIVTTGFCGARARDGFGRPQNPVKEMLIWKIKRDTVHQMVTQGGNFWNRGEGEPAAQPRVAGNPRGEKDKFRTLTPVH